MGTFEDIQAELGADFFTRRTDAQLDRHNWQELCVCGHLARYHAQTVGGLYRVPETVVTTNRKDEEWSQVHVFNGCVGSLKPRGFDEYSDETDRENHIVTRTISPTCPCTEFRPLANVDRPNRYFNQRIPHTVERQQEFIRHPFLVGIRAFTTHLSRRRAALADPSWPAAEFERRFTWVDSARRCDRTNCRQTDDVWPVFVNPSTSDLRSELRCPKHR